MKLILYDVVPLRDHKLANNRPVNRLTGIVGVSIRGIVTDLFG